MGETDAQPIAPHDGSPIDLSDRWRWPFLIAIVALLALGGVAVLQYTRFTDATERVEQTYDVLDAIDTVLIRLVDAETSHRGYLLTGDGVFLEPYQGVLSELRGMLDRVELLVADNPVQHERAQRLSADALAKIDEMSGTLGLYHTDDVPGAIARLRSGEGRLIMDRVRATAAEMRAAETSLLTQRANQADLAGRSALLFGIVTVLVAIVLGLLAVSVHRNFQRRHVAYATELAARMQAQREALDAAAYLRQSEDINRTILDNSGDCIQLLDPDGSMLLVNGPGLAAMEIDDANVLQGRPWTSTWGSDAELARQSMNDAMATGEGRFRAFRSTAKGTPKWWEVIVTPVRSDRGRVLQLVATSRDITVQKQREDERAQLLASERAARSEAERAARMKDDFVSTLSHELRTPLNAILGWVGVLRQDQTPETLTKAIDVIDRNSRRQSQMIDDLLDVSRIISGKLRLDVQRLDVASSIEEAVASAQPAADAKGIRLLQILGSAAIIQGDPGRLQQIVWNLVSNAIKFTPRGGRVQVTLRKVNSHVHIQVSDTGQGMSPDVLPYVFERFRQADASINRQQTGLGLGLAIVKNLVEMHGGSVDAASEGLGLGSVFTVRLPLALASSRGEPTSSSGDPMPAPFARLLNGVAVLVLDDELDARELVQRLLENAGARVKTAASAEEALGELRQGFMPDMIVSDIGMPEQDGYEFMQHVRGMNGAVSAVPAAALTAMARVEDRKRALLSGYQTHLAKPVDPAELIAMVASLTGRTGRARA